MHFYGSPKEAARRELMREAERSFPNNTGGYASRPSREEQPTPKHTVEERRQQLKAAFEKGPVPNFFAGRLRRGRTVRKTIVGILVNGKAYKFNGPRQHVRKEKPEPQPATIDLLA